MDVRVTPILTQYSSDVSFKYLLTILGVAAKERSQFTSDRFTSMSLLVKYFAYDVRSIKSHLHALNKTFANTFTARMIYFNLICTNFLVGVLYYFTQAINTFHTILNIDTIDQDMADK